MVRLVVDLLRAVLAVGPRGGGGGGGSKGKGKGMPHEIGVITPYKAQAWLLPSLPSLLTVAVLAMALLTMALITMALLTAALLAMPGKATSVTARSGVQPAQAQGP